MTVNKKKKGLYVLSAERALSNFVWNISNKAYFTCFAFKFCFLHVFSIQY